jgi:lysozyme family protein
MTFDEAFERLIGHEGGYVNDPRDPGGETKFGISKRSYPGEDIPNMTLERAKDIYRRDFWNPVRADELPESVRFDVFDAAVNHGVLQSAKWLQRAAGAQPDGVIGAKTIAAARSAGPQLAAHFNGYRLQFYTDSANWAIYGKGWTRRVASNLQRLEA